MNSKSIRFSLQDISTYRSSLMGIAMVWILFYHFGFHTVGFSHLMRFGYTGVDIFMFLSGFGLYYSLNRNGDLQQYYKKRILRIFPAYFFVGIFLCLFCYPDSNIGNYLWRCSTLGFWTNGDYYEWFIPSIISLYCIFPFIYKSLLSHKRSTAYCIVILIFIAAAIYNVFNHSIIDNWHFLLIYRIPIFLYGALIACHIHNGQGEKDFKWVSVIGIVIFITFFVIPGLRTRYMAFTFLTPLLIMFSCAILKKITIINKWGGVIGTASLEIYLIHLVFLKYLRLTSLDFREEYFDLSTIILMVVSTTIGILLHKLISQCIHL